MERKHPQKSVVFQSVEKIKEQDLLTLEASRSRGGCYVFFGARVGADDELVEVSAGRQDGVNCRDVGAVKPSSRPRAPWCGLTGGRRRDDRVNACYNWKILKRLEEKLQGANKTCAQKHFSAKMWSVHKT